MSRDTLNANVNNQSFTDFPNSHIQKFIPQKMQSSSGSQEVLLEFAFERNSFHESNISEKLQSRMIQFHVSHNSGNSLFNLY